LLFDLGLAMAGPAWAAAAVTLYASPTGSGSVCSQAAPCSLNGAQSAVRAKLAAADGGPQQTVSTLATARQTNAVVCTTSGLARGTHTIVVTKLSGRYSTLDGFAVRG
jgi:hypothetical protein